MTTFQPEIPVTVVIPTKNEEENLPRCLSRLAGFHQVIVVDSGSTDKTREITAEFGFKLVDFNWNGAFPKKRNWTLLNETFFCDWVFFLDADEQLTNAFKEELARTLNNTTYVGFWLNYRNFFRGKRLNYGIRQRKLALFRLNAGLYERIDDRGWSNFDMEVHEHPILEGPVGEIHSPIDHCDYRGLHHFIGRHNDYSTWEARRYIQFHTRPTRNNVLTDRQKIKYRYIDAWWFAPSYFFMTYFIRLGLLDGAAGLGYAVQKFIYFHNIREKIRELTAVSWRRRLFANKSE